MKTEILVAAILFFTASASSVVATYHGQIEKEGPKASFIVGFASDETARIELSVEDKKDLNVSHTEQYMFSPDQTSRRIERQGSYISLKEFSINISSSNPQKKVYEIPVVLRAYSDINSSGSATPRLVNEREYTFRYRTQLSPDYGIEGGLINSSEAEEQQKERTTQENASENTIIDQNQTSKRDERGEVEPESDTSLMLLAGVLLVFGYTIYEALT